MLITEYFIGCDWSGPDPWTCCNSRNKCELSEGHCESDWDCDMNYPGGLICETGKCPRWFPSNASCCIRPQCHKNDDCTEDPYCVNGRCGK